MSYINSIPAEDWIEENHPENGLFRVYWKDVGKNYRGGESIVQSTVATLDPNEGEGLRYEWYYKDGVQNGMARAWWPNGQYKSKGTYKDGIKDGLWTWWQYYTKLGHLKSEEGIYKDGTRQGLWTYWYENGQIEYEKNYKDGKLIEE
jgi:hypothetical protein